MPIVLEIPTRGEIPPLTSGQVRPIVFFDLAIDDIRAQGICRCTGTLASMKVVSEAPTPGAKLIIRMSAVRVLALLRGCPV